jgi:GNAT superfamily N-acetyltransferase
MPDMLVKLYKLDDAQTFTQIPEGVTIKRAFITDKDAIIAFKKEIPDEAGFPYECEFALMQNPPTCFIAVKGGELVGVACYDASAKGFAGPMGVREDVRGIGIGKALLLRILFAMKESGYAYAILGWPAGKAVGFYEKTVNAVPIDGAAPQNSIYRNMIRFT